MQGIAVDRWVPHLAAEEVSSCDTVIGTLPVQIAAEVCARDARYLNLSLDLPFEWRGRELSAVELVVAEARLEEYFIFRGTNK
jgi:CRISPR-associated protein Csx16